MSGSDVCWECFLSSRVLMIMIGQVRFGQFELLCELDEHHGRQFSLVERLTDSNSVGMQRLCILRCPKT